MSIFGYCINYDLVEPHDENVANYRKVIGAIKALGTTAEVLRSTWLVRTHMSAAQIRDYLKDYVQDGDRLFVCEMSNWSSWHAMNNVDAFIGPQ